MAIRFRGMLTDFKQLEEGTLPEGAKMLDEGDNVDEVIAAGIRQTLPMFVVMALLTVARFVKGLNWAVENSLGEIFLYSVIAIAVYVVLIVLHEVIHALFYPVRSEKNIWLYGAQAAMIFSSAKISKTRFIVLSLAPTVLLGFMPFILWLLYAPLVSPAASVSWLVVCWLMVFGGVGDFYNVKNVLAQVPKNALVFNYGIHTYWIEKEERH